MQRVSDNGQPASEDDDDDINNYLFNEPVDQEKLIFKAGDDENDIGKC